MQGKIQSEERNAKLVYAGIDVCKDRLDVYFHPSGHRLAVANNRIGIQRLKREIIRQDAVHVVMEATAKYHRLAHRTLSHAGVDVTVVNPLRSRLFAEACGALAKTDQVDARMLAGLGAALRPRVTPPAPEVVETIQELVHARNAAAKQRVMLENRLSTLDASFLKTELRRLIKSLDGHIKRIAK